MRELHFVTRTEQGQLLVESPDGLEQYLIPVVDALRTAVAGALPGVSTASTPPATGPSNGSIAAAPAAEPASISPREIQVRVRAGESPQAVADDHGLPVEHVMRFATPVIAERSRITDEARRARARRTGYDDAEPRVVAFGEAVDERYEAHGIDVGTVLWDSRRREDGEWVVLATWAGGEGTHSAEWLFHKSSRTVTPLDDSAADLLSDRPIRPVAPPPRSAAARLSAPALAPGVIAFPPFPDAHTGPLPRVEEVFDQESHVEGPRTLPPFSPVGSSTPVASTTPAPSAAAAPVPASTTSRKPAAAPALPSTPMPMPEAGELQFDEQPLPLVISEAEGRPAAAAGTVHNLASRRTAETEDDKASRARIPSWDDILLGVRRKED